MYRAMIGLALVALACVPMSAVAQATMGYDAYGRLICVYHPTSTPKITRYVYDAAGNRTQRTVAAAAGQTCTSQSVGPPPTPPVQLTATNPTLSTPVASNGSTSLAMTALGSASDSSTLSLVSANTAGGSGSCGTASVTTSTLSYTAPALTPATATLTCYVDYVFGHTNGQQKTGRVTLTVQGEDPPGGGGEGGGEPCVPNPQTGLCEVG
ncbi:MAG: RHS repeat domain-containing protein [Candidatus Woesebacteria bacterium]|nr:RHS repeat domain-containing protein [Candidatus Woesebacteria bacterium]